MNLSNPLLKLPPELTEREQWCNFVIGPERGDNGKLIKKPVISGSFAEIGPSSTDSRSWRTFADAVKHQERHYAEGRPGECYTAFVLRKADHIVFLDIDGGTPEEDVETLLETFPHAYVEDSASGEGIHLLFRGTLDGKGRKKGSLELYDTARWVIMTGKVWQGNEKIGESDPSELKRLEEQFDRGVFHTGGEIALDQVQIKEDSTIVAELIEMHRNGKFKYLYYDGNWKAFGYPSQSEADFALVGMLASASRNNEQVLRLFQNSALFRPEKKRAGPYALREHRARQAENDKTDLWFTELANKTKEKYLQASPRVCPNSDKIFTDIPKGLLRDIYSAYLDWAYYPVRESCLIAAMVTALALFQRKYQTPTGLGLNMWLFLLGDAGAGKDTLKRGPKTLFMKAKAMTEGVLGGQIRGDRGLVDSLKNNPRQCAYHPECAAWLKSMCSERASTQAISLKDALTSSWTDSTTTLEIPQRMLEKGGKREIEIVRPCLTLYGEAVPEFFYDAVGVSQIAGGFMPRFTVLETDCTPGLLPTEPGPQNPFPAQLLQQIYNHAKDAAEHDACMADPVEVPWSNRDAKRLFDEMAKELRIRQTNKNCNPITNFKNTLIGRSAEKTIKLATLAAVCESPESPAVAERHMRWAMEFVTVTDNRMISQLVSGDHDAAAHNQLQVMRNLIIKATNMSVAERAKSNYSAKPEVQTNPNLIPYGWLNTHCRGKSCFKTAHNGTAAAIDNTIKELINRGEIVEYTQEEKNKMQWTGRMFLNIGVGIED